MNKYLSIRMQKIDINKTNVSFNRSKKGRRFLSFKEQYEHDYRIMEMEKDYIKHPNKSKLNKSKYLKSVKEVENMFIDIKSDYEKNHGKKLHSQTKPVINFLLSFSENFHLENEEQREEQFKSVCKFVESSFGVENICYINQQNDEKSLHYSICIMNYDYKTHRPIAKQLDTSKLQDNISNHLINDKQDYGHIRGVKKVVSNKEHLSIMEGKLKEKEEELHKLEYQIEEHKRKEEKLYQKRRETILKTRYKQQDNRRKIKEHKTQIDNLLIEFEDLLAAKEREIDLITSNTIKSYLKEIRLFETLLNDMGIVIDKKNGLDKILDLINRFKKSGNLDRLLKGIEKIKIKMETKVNELDNKTNQTKTTKPKNYR